MISISASFNLTRVINFYRGSSDIDKFYCNSELFFFCEEIFYHIYVFKISRMFVQSKQNALNAAQNPLKVRPCFIRLLRDKELDKHIRKRYKKNETEVNKNNIIYTCVSHHRTALVKISIEDRERAGASIIAVNDNITNIFRTL